MRRKTTIVCLIVIFFLILESRVSCETEFGNVYHAHKNTDQKIALTFDDGPHPRLTPEILDILKKYDIHATFFLVGKNAELYPELVSRILSEGHEIGNHTFTHGAVGALGYDQIKQEIEACESLIYEIADYRTKLLRPPEGELDAKTKIIAKQIDYNLILWNIDTKDWAHTPPVVISRNICENITPGSIILMHDYISYNSPTPKALELFIPKLLNGGYRFVVVSDLIGSN